MEKTTTMAKKRDPLLELDLEELIFEGPFNRGVSRNLVLSNPSRTLRVAFKMKTTSPRLFFVRPNIGVLDPKQQVTVEIYVQPIVQRQELKQQKRHKFLILAAEVMVGVEMANLPDFWKNQKPNDIWDTKIKCFLFPDKEERLREAGGGSEPPSPTGSEANQGDQLGSLAPDDSMNTLRSQVKALQDERQALLEKITLYNKDPVAPFNSKSRRFFFIIMAFITILVVVLAAYAAGKLEF